MVQAEESLAAASEASSEETAAAVKAAEGMVGASAVEDGAERWVVCQVGKVVGLAVRGVRAAGW